MAEEHGRAGTSNVTNLSDEINNINENDRRRSGEATRLTQK
jgi:hypothetical protein